MPALRQFLHVDGELFRPEFLFVQIMVTCQVETEFFELLATCSRKSLYWSKILPFYRLAQAADG